MTTENLIIGLGIIVLNLIPLILKKYKYISLTLVISMILVFIRYLL